MKLSNILGSLIIALLVTTFYSCVPNEIILHGDISGTVTDTETSQPVMDVAIALNQSNVITDTTSTGSDGSYLFHNISAGNYEIEALKSTYTTVTKNAVVVSAKTTEINLEIVRTASIEFSDTYLDYGVDATLMSFTISNKGSGTLKYSLIESQDWITINPTSGDVTTEKDTITVSIDRALLSEETQKERISITSIVGDVDQQDQIDVFVNGVLQEELFYKIVRIGTQVWMAENLNRGLQIPYAENIRQRDNEIVEKFCYDNDIKNCEIYGGLYSWSELMDYNPPDAGIIGTTQGICPDGWHLPTINEWETLSNYLGGERVAGGALKDTGNIQDGTGFWGFPNEASNISGFTALPAGRCYWGLVSGGYTGLGGSFNFETASDNNSEIILRYNENRINFDIDGPQNSKNSHPVRCIKDP